MEELIKYLHESIDNEVLSKSERKSLKVLLSENNLNRDDLNFLRSKVFEIAVAKATPSNYKFILEWIRNTTNSLLPSQDEEHSTAFFSPGEACRETIIHQIQHAVRHMHICVFTISDDAISSAILVAHQKGILIRIITDNDKAEDLGSDIERIARSGVSVRIDRSSNHMHHKFMVTDDTHLITGSYNWTLSAAKYNHENILLTSEPSVVKSFLKQFEQLWSQMEPVT